jgi:iron(III) transport system substrate-binding protein
MSEDVAGRWKSSIAVVVALILSLALAACGSSDDTTTTTGQQAAAGRTSSDWTPDPALVERARAEGEVVMYNGSMDESMVEALKKGFEDRFGIKATIVQKGTIVTLVDAERKAGSVKVDIVSESLPDAFVRWNEERFTLPAEVPNVERIAPGVDDPDTPDVPTHKTPYGIIYNEAQADPPPSTWEEFISDGSLAPVVVGNPENSGSTLFTYTELLRTAGPDALDRLSDREIVRAPDTLSTRPILLTGEAIYGAPGSEQMVASARAQGEPLQIAFMKDLVPLMSGTAAVVDGPHPSAGKLMLQYMLTEEYQQALVDTGMRSILEDMPLPEGVPEIPADARTVTFDARAVIEAEPRTVAAYKKAFG